MIPHSNPTQANRRSRAPYNFVPLPGAVLAAPDHVAQDGTSWQPWRQHDRDVPDTYSGWLDVTVTAETPLYVRCAPKVVDIEREDAPVDGADAVRRYRHRQAFFHGADPHAPLIPGSSFRGAIRSLFEIMSYARLRWYSGRRRLVYRAVADKTALGSSYRQRMLGPARTTGGPGLAFEYPGANVKAGYLRRQGIHWEIQPARRFGGESFIHVEESIVRGFAPMRAAGQAYSPRDTVKVFVRPQSRRSRPSRSNPGIELNLAVARTAGDVVEDRGGTPPGGFERGTLVRSGPMSQKHMHCVLFEPDPNSIRLSIPPDMWQLYAEDRDLTRGIKVRPLEADGDPLFYLEERGQLVFFGPTMMFRLPYADPIDRFVPEAIRGRAEDPSPDMAEAVFGTVDLAEAIKGRVRFEDLNWVPSEGSPFLSDTPVVLQILSAPKPTSFQHYLVQPDVQAPRDPRQRQDPLRPGADDRHTLHSWAQPPGQPVVFKDARNQTLATGPGTEIRGHKRYWHKNPTTVDDIRDADARINTNRDGVEAFTPRNGWRNSTQHTAVSPVKTGTQFSGKIRFDNLALSELGALLAAVMLPASKRHHLGMGKPLGMGSARLDATLNVIRRRGDAARYTRLLADDGTWHTGSGASDENERVKTKALKAFQELVEAHVAHTEAQGRRVPFWEIPRLQELAALLEWDDAPDRRATAYESLGQGGPSPWRDRVVLPTPSGVAGRPQASPVTVTSGRGVGTSPTVGATLKQGTRIACVILEEKTKKGGWKAKVKVSGQSGAILPGEAPDGLAAGQEVELVIHALDPQGAPTFKWPK